MILANNMLLIAQTSALIQRTLKIWMKLKPEPGKLLLPNQLEKPKPWYCLSFR